MATQGMAQALHIVQNRQPSQTKQSPSAKGSSDDSLFAGLLLKLKDGETKTSDDALMTKLAQMFQTEDPESEQELSLPFQNMSDKEKRLHYQNLLSRLYLSKTMQSATAEHDLKQARSLDEMMKMAKKYGLNPQEMKIEADQTKHQATNLSHLSETSLQASKSILLRHSHISQHVAALNLDMQLQEKVSEEPPSLQEILQQVQTKKRRSSGFIDIPEELKALVSPKKEEQVAKLETPNLVHHDQSAKFADALSQKIVDAKQMVQNFAKSLREQVENYKPPVTRMQLTLDPKDLGKVEVTLVSRGNNLHIQVNSNPTAIGLMATQGQELKNQLVSMGFSDVQMQFNMNQQQQQQRKEHGGRSEHGYMALDEIPEIYESLDIIIPQYV